MIRNGSIVDCHTPGRSHSPALARGSSSERREPSQASMRGKGSSREEEDENQLSAVGQCSLTVPGLLSVSLVDFFGGGGVRSPTCMCTSGSGCGCFSFLSLFVRPTLASHCCRAHAHFSRLAVRGSDDDTCDITGRSTPFFSAPFPAAAPPIVAPSIASGVPVCVPVSGCSSPTQTLNAIETRGCCPLPPSSSLSSPPSAALPSPALLLPPPCYFSDLQQRVQLGAEATRATVKDAPDVS